MSFDIFLQGFDAGNAAPVDKTATRAVLAVLDPLVIHRASQWVRIATSDGEADVYGIDDPSSGLMFSHASGRHVWDVMFDVALAAGFVVIPGGCGTGVTDEATIAELPKGVPEPIVIIRSGADLLDLVESA
jgi:hypothetical protein